MRAREFITERFESRIGDLQDGVARTIPAMHVIPALQNQDAYKQYRFGLALASSGPGQPHAAHQSPWGENMAVGAYSEGDEQILDAALKAYGVTSRMISTKKSEEPKGTNVTSPVAARKKNRYGI